MTDITFSSAGDWQDNTSAISGNMSITYSNGLYPYWYYYQPYPYYLPTSPTTIVQTECEHCFCQRSNEYGVITKDGNHKKCCMCGTRHKKKFKKIG